MNVKVRAFIFSFLSLTGTIAAHESHPEGHHESQILVSQISPVLIASIAMTLAGLLTLAFSVRKYRSN